MFIQTNGDTSSDVIDGGIDVDTVDYSNLAGKLSVTLDTTTAVNVKLTGINNHTIASIENIIATAQDDTLVGDSNNNLFKGLSGVDTLYGEDGNDTLEGGDAGDILRGGAGDDIFAGGTLTYNVNGSIASHTDGSTGDVDIASYSDATVSVNVDLSLTQGNAINVGTGLGSDVFYGIEGVIGGSADDTLKGTIGANSLIGGLGNDTLLGGGVSGGSATVYDYIEGGEGSEDFVSYSYLTNVQKAEIDLSNTAVQNAIDAGYINISTVENLEGGAGADTLYGNETDNTLIGREGIDVFRGADGADAFIGGIATITAGVVTGNSDSSVDKVDYSSLSGGNGIVADMNVSGENDTTLEIGRVTNDGFGKVDTLYGIEHIIASNYVDNITGDSDDGVANSF